MIYFIIGIAYVLFVVFIIRFFQAVHRWDDEIKNMDKEKKEGVE